MTITISFYRAGIDEKVLEISYSCSCSYSATKFQTSLARITGFGSKASRTLQFELLFGRNGGQ
jgi:hypothetical protein